MGLVGGRRGRAVAARKAGESGGAELFERSDGTLCSFVHSSPLLPPPHRFLAFIDSACGAGVEYFHG